MLGNDALSLAARAKRYSHIKYTLSLAETAYLLLLVVLFLETGFSKSLSLLFSNLLKNEFLIFPSYLLTLLLSYYFLSLPLNFYRSYILERKFSLSNEKLASWVIDQLKMGVISYLIALIIFSAFYFLLGRFAHTWWLAVSLFWVFFSLGLAKLLPTVIIPIFFKYKILNDLNLKNRILNLAHKMKVRIMDVFEIDFSKKTLKANAAFVGWGKTRRVILADTLKDKYSLDEIEVILAHEFAHYRLKHLFKLMFINALTTLGIFFIIFKTNNLMLGFFGLSRLGDLAAFPLVILYFTPFGLITQPLGNYISRRFEKNADIAAIKETGLKDAFISMMNKLSEQNLSDRNPHPLIKFFFFDHPPIEERIKMAAGNH